MLKAILFVIGFSAVFISISVFIITQSEEISTEEGFLYSAIGCTSLYLKLEEPDKTGKLLNLINNFSETQGITEVRPGYIDRFIKLVEKKWEKENDVAKRNCEGIVKHAAGEPKPAQYNAVAQSVIAYLDELKANKNETATERAERVLKEKGVNIEKAQ